MASLSVAPPGLYARSGPLRVAFLTLNLRTGGLEKVVLLLATGLLERGHRVRLFAVQGPVSHPSLSQGLRQQIDMLSPNPLPFFWRRVPSFVQQLRLRLGPRCGDVVCAFGGQAVILARLAGISPLVVGIQNSYGLHWRSLRPGHVLLSLAESWAMTRDGNTFVACSPSAAAAYRRRFAIPPSLMHVILNATDVEVFSRASLKKTAVGWPVRLLCVGTLYGVKNFQMALRALALLNGRGAMARLAVAGEGPARAELGRLSEHLGVGGFVDFLGDRPDIPALMAHSDVLWVTSKREGFGLVLAEAMAAGLPVVATRVPGVVDVVKDGETALLVDVDDAAGLAAATLSLLRDSVRRTSLVERARMVALAEYNPRRMTHDYEELLLSLPGRSEPSGFRRTLGG